MEARTENIIKKRLESFAFEKTSRISLSYKLVPVQYRGYEYSDRNMQTFFRPKCSNSDQTGFKTTGVPSPINPVNEMYTKNNYKIKTAFNRIYYRGLASRPRRLSPWMWYQLLLVSQYPGTVRPTRRIIGIQLRYLPIILSKAVTWFRVKEAVTFYVKKLLKFR